MKATIGSGRGPGVPAKDMRGDQLYYGCDGGLFFRPHDNRAGQHEPVVLRLPRGTEPPFIVSDPNAYGPYTPVPLGTTYTLEVN